MKRTAAGIALLVVVVGLVELSNCRQAPAAEVFRPEDKRDSWDVYYIQGARVGYSHTTTRDIGSGRVILRTESVSQFSLRRGDDPTTPEIRVVTWETPGGGLLNFVADIRMGPKPVHITGQVQGNRLDIEATGTAAAPVKVSIPWSADSRGPFAMEQSLLRKPMKPGERRKIKMLAIESLQVADLDMTAKDYEPCKLLTGVHNLLRIDTVTQVADQKIEQTLWVSRTGEILKTYVPNLRGMQTYRVSKAEALQKTDAVKLDLLPLMMVKVDKPLADPFHTSQVCYRVHLDRNDPASAFVTGPTQAIKSIDANTADITVYAIRPGRRDGNRNAPPEQPTADDLRPNIWVQSDDPVIVADAKKVAPDETDPWRVAMALERFVRGEVKNKNFTQGFASAAEVARSREGDCTEHAVFLMALCRARGIPARGAFGLVYMPSNNAPAFFYHMWAEVYVDKRWIPIDGVFAQGGIGAAYLKIGQTNLKDATAYSAFLPALPIMGQLKMKIVSAK
jgi:hypothetical protein